MSQKHEEDLSHIRSMMERSSRFISLSGLSGVFAGISALVGGLYTYQLFDSNGRLRGDKYDLIPHLLFVAILVLAFALIFAIFFTIRKSRKYNLPVWTSATRKMLFNLFVPLAVGGVFCLALMYHGLFGMIAPATLVFYGLALINAEKYTFSDIKYLGFCELILGCVSLFFIGKGLVFWILGFGVLHILYGLVMFKKYN